MRIVQLLPNLDAYRMDHLVMGLARQQSDAGYEPLLYCPTHGGTLAPDAEAAGIPGIDFGKQAGFSCKLTWEIARRQMAAEAKRVAETQFSFDAMRGRYDRLYLSLGGAH
jgi:hypothetical protein